VRTYPSHSSILYTLHPKHAGCEYPNDTSRWERFQASTTVCGHSIHFRSNMCGQICAAELSKKTLISGADPRRRSRAERIGITEIKIEKGAILSHHNCQPMLVPMVYRHAQTTDPPVRATSAGLYFHTQNSDRLDCHVSRSHVLLCLPVVSVPIPWSLILFVSNSLLL
jgi:hypothetical protein